MFTIKKELENKHTLKQYAIVYNASTKSALSESDIKEGLFKVVEKNVLPDLKIDDDSINYIANVSGSDLRYAYNLLELAYYSKDDHLIDLEFLKSIDNKHNFFHDKKYL